MRCGLLLTLLALAACSHNPPIPSVVSEPCIRTAPTPPEQCVPTDDSRVEWLRCELVTADKLRGYVIELETVVKGCSK